MVRRMAAMVLVLTLLMGTASAARVRLVVMDGINLEHLQDQRLENFQRLLDEGALGLANANTAGRRTAGNAAITLGAGSRALGPGAETVFHNQDEFEGNLAGTVQQRRTGVSPNPGALVLPNIARIREANSELMHTVQIGYLAQTLAAAGRTTAALVNADDNEANRAAAAIVANGNGLISAGDVGRDDLLNPAPPWPFGVQADLSAFVDALEELDDVDLVVVDMGETSRAQEYSHLVLEEFHDHHRFQALAQVDLLLGEILDRQMEDDLLLVTSLQAQRKLGEEEGKWLVPILAHGSISKGLLTSASTRRPGVVTNIDVTATILRHFGLFQPGEIHGQPLESVPHAEPFQYLMGREKEMAGVYRLRTPLVKGYIGIIIVLVALSVAALVFKWRRRGVLKLAILAVTASPLLLLLLGIMPGTVWMVPVWIILALVLALVLRRLEPTRAMGLLGAVTALAVVVDALAGAWLQQRSILGYDAIAGARYYGIGNEFMGVLLGSTILAVSGYLPRRKVVAAVAFSLVVLMLLLPGVGANFGGTLAALTGFGLTLMGLACWTEKKHRRVAVSVLLAAGAALLLFNLVGGQSHVGRFFTAVYQDPREFWLAVQRKVDMAWRLVRWSMWSRAFAALLVAALWLLLTQRHLLARKFGQRWPLVRGTMAAALAALLLNDSGVVAAATTLLYLTFPLLYYEFCSNSSNSDSHSP